MSALVVYFSRSGHTRQVAKEIAARCGGDLEEVREQDSREGVWGYWRSAWQVLTRSEPTIQAAAKDPADYDTVIIGTPIWIAHPAPPVRTFVRRHALKFNRVAFFCTEGGSGERKAFAELSRLCGKTPVATLAVTEKQLQANLHADALDHFQSQIAP